MDPVMELRVGSPICVATGRGDVVCMLVRRLDHGHSKLMGGKYVLIQYGPRVGVLGPDEVEGTVFITDQGITWDLGWDDETMQALAAAAALTAESEHDINDIDLTEAMEGIFQRPVH
jgi:hypothetical protein